MSGKHQDCVTWIATYAEGEYQGHEPNKGVNMARNITLSLEDARLILGLLDQRGSPLERGGEGTKFIDIAILSQKEGVAQGHWPTDTCTSDEGPRFVFGGDAIARLREQIRSKQCI